MTFYPKTHVILFYSVSFVSFNTLAGNNTPAGNFTFKEKYYLRFHPVRFSTDGVLPFLKVHFQLCRCG